MKFPLVPAAVARFLKAVKAQMQAVPVEQGTGGWFNIVRESFAGAWQSFMIASPPTEMLAFSAVYSSVTIIASDIAKLMLEVVIEDRNGVCTPVPRSNRWARVLYKPNGFQTRLKFIEQWIISKLLYGNTYVLKERDEQGNIVALYILDARKVQPLVAENGDVYYRLSKDNLSGVEGTTVVPASEIIHDMMVSLWHPLVGISPLYACAVSTQMGNKIQSNSVKFFDNMSRPSGMLTAPGSISDEVAKRLKEAWEQNFSGSNIGRLAVLGDNLTYAAMTIPAQEAQLIEQLKWTVEDVARCFHVPLYKLGGTVPAGSTVETLNQAYYSDCLQTLIESVEICLDEGLGLPERYYTQFDIEGLLRMDKGALIKSESDAVKGGIKAPNESRKKLNLKPVKGGDSPYMQQQNYSLEALAKRDALPDPFGTKTPPAAPPATPPEDDQASAKLVSELVELVRIIRPEPLALPAPAALSKPQHEEEEFDEEAAELFIEGLAEEPVAV